MVVDRKLLYLIVKDFEVTYSNYYLIFFSSLLMNGALFRNIKKNVI